VNVLRHPAFLAGETDTAFFDRHGLGTLAAPLADAATVELAALAGALAVDAAERAGRTILRGIPSGWRNVVSQPQRVVFEGHDVEYRLTRDGGTGVDGVRLLAATPEQVVLDVDGVRRAFAVDVTPAEVYVDSPLGPVRLRRVPRFVDPSEQVAHGSLLAPMPGAVVRLAVAAGDRVKAGEAILWLEAMKMQHRINAPSDGVVAELPVHEGQQIDVGAVLAVVTEEEQ
ncbi:MAG: acetyl-CoA carboxylase subunit alpha, partial [Actinobacteria bacterium]|nr:acetyl-CoA carboxylase subunit alpha [Actinomycetota bacterium]